MRAGRTRLTALGCVFALLALLAVRAPLASGSAGHQRPHGVHVAAAAAALAQGHSRPDLPSQLPGIAQLPHDFDRAVTTLVARELPLRAPVAVRARGPPGGPA